MLRLVNARGLSALSVALVLLSAGPSRTALAFGGTAPNLERQGNFVITNDAELAFDQQIGNGGGTTFSLRPALDYFVINHLSIGGAIELGYTSGHPNVTTIQLVPEVGYEFAFSDTWSFWPQVSLPLVVPSPGSASLAVALFFPFLVHPAEHFFFGAGPGFSQVVTSPATTHFTAAFIIGGYFDH
jgi:hypothetical protein